MLTAGTGSHEAQERREAARALLMRPILVQHRHAEELALVRRHAAALRSTFLSMLGLHLVVESGFARLLKAPLSDDAPSRPVRRTNGSPFTARGYAYFTLVCAGLLAPDVGDQVLLSQLVEQLRADAAGTGIEIDDTLPERRSLVAAIEVLIDWGVLVETDGTVVGWGERREEALLSITRGLLPHLLAHPLHRYAGPEEIGRPEPGVPEQPRRSLRRKLVDNPFVGRHELTLGEQDALSRDRTELTRMLDEAFGLTLEVRAEGALAYDVGGRLTDVQFPGTGTVRQAALLLLDALIDNQRPAGGTQAPVGERSIPGMFTPWPSVDAEIEQLSTRYARMWRHEEPGQLRAAVVDLLVAMSLATPTDDGLIVHPLAARYRPDPQLAPTKTRARRRLAADSALVETPDLFTETM